MIFLVIVEEKLSDLIELNQCTKLQKIVCRSIERVLENPRQLG